MHPNRGFDWSSRDEMLSFVQEISFRTIFASGPEGAGAIHAPVMIAPPDRLRLHISRFKRVWPR